MSRKTVAVLLGGISVEHEISLVSSRFVIENLDSSKFSALAIFISKNGRWQRAFHESWKEGETPAVVPDSEIVPMLSDSPPGRFAEIIQGEIKNVFPVDVVFPVLHGTFGEDGTVQGLVDLMGVPCVGADVLGSSLCIDKIVSKTILRDNDIPVVPFFGFEKSEWSNDREKISSRLRDEIGFPCFVKSSNLGSSVGVSKVNSLEQFPVAVEASFDFSQKVIVERAVSNPKEVEISVMGNQYPQASVPGEIVLGGTFYDYDEKYRNESAELLIPCDLSLEIQERIKALALDSYMALCCSGMARVDFLVDLDTKEIFVSEINTIPGFTPISMYPKLWEASGLQTGEMLERLISLAESRHRIKRELRTDFSAST